MRKRRSVTSNCLKMPCRASSVTPGSKTHDEANLADDADAKFQSGAMLSARIATALLMVIRRLRERPLRAKVTSIPISRRNVAVRRSLPASERGDSASRCSLPDCSPALMIADNSVAVPVHEDRETIYLCNALASGSLSTKSLMTRRRLRP
jgi:hypothetical protein